MQMASWLSFIYILPNLIAAIGMMVVAVMAWRYRNQRGGFALWLFAVSAFIWAFFESLNFVGLPSEYIRFLWRIEAIGVAVAPLAMMVCIINYFGYGQFLTKRLIALLSIIPASLILSAWITPLNPLIWESVFIDESGIIPILSNSVGVMCWIYYGYSALLMFATISFLWLRFPELQPPQRRQVYRVIIAMLLPFLAAICYLEGMTLLPNTTYTTLAFNISGIMLIRGFFKDRLFELPPVTAYEIYRNQDDAVFVLDDTNRVLDLNIAARKILSLAGVECIGHLIAESLPQVQYLLGVENKDSENRGELLLGEQCYDVRLMALRSRDSQVSGRLMVWREISERKKLEAELQRLAVTDELTGLFNRRHFFARGAKDIEHARRYSRPLSLIMVDVDHFKEVNDQYGHEAGDRALVLLARTLSSRLRNVDCIGRIGGEEFALLLPETTAEAAYEVGRRLMDEVAETRMMLPEGGLLSLTISMGIATLHDEETAMNTFLRRSDAALYQAKGRGRNTIVQL